MYNNLDELHTAEGYLLPAVELRHPHNAEQSADTQSHVVGHVVGQVGEHVVMHLQPHLESHGIKRGGLSIHLN